MAISVHSSADTWDGFTITVPSKSGTTYTVASCANLAWLAQQVNAGTTFSGYTFTVVSDLNLNNKSWTPIGISFSTTFKGTFNGEGYTISNLYISGSWSYSYWGLFGYISSPAILENIVLSGASVSSYNTVSGLVGYTQGTSSSSTVEILNCSVSGTITNNSWNPCGGLVGDADSYTTIQNCSFSGSVSGDSQTGGLVGLINSTLSFSNNYSTGSVTGNQYTGGFAGTVSAAATFQGCYSTASVTPVGDYAGGFVGYLSGNAPVYNCFATGTLSSSSNNSGGFIGYSNSTAPIANCYAMGEVSGLCYVGGFIGDINASQSIVNCYATGAVIGVGNNPGGGFVGGVSS